MKNKNRAKGLTLTGSREREVNKKGREEKRKEGRYRRRPLRHSRRVVTFVVLRFSLRLQPTNEANGALSLLFFLFIIFFFLLTSTHPQPPAATGPNDPLYYHLSPKTLKNEIGKDYKSHDFSLILTLVLFLIWNLPKSICDVLISLLIKLYDGV
ncbi:unnamed protein product [Camellia sinensis]